MPYKFEQLEVWQLALDHIDSIYGFVEELPRSEDFNLRYQIIRSATSVEQNIAEGCTGQSDAELTHFLGMSIRSLIETVACLHLIQRRHFINDESSIYQVFANSQMLACKLQSFHKSILAASSHIREDATEYFIETDEYLSSIVDCPSSKI